ncbi:MAG: hypothetical protein K1W07_08960 [Parabacteroides distasonis]
MRHRSSWSLTSKCSSLTRGTWFHNVILTQRLPLLLLPRLGLWSRDKAAKGKAVAAIGAVGQIDATATEVEVVGGVSVRASSRRPVIAVLASAVKGDFSVWGYVLTAEIDKPAPHKEEWT